MMQHLENENNYFFVKTWVLNGSLTRKGLRRLLLHLTRVERSPAKLRVSVFCAVYFAQRDIGHRTGQDVNLLDKQVRKCTQCVTSLDL